MRTLDRYVLRELLVPFWIGIAVGVLLLVGTLLVAYAREIVNNGVPVLLVLKLLVLKLPECAVIAMPMAMAFAASLAVNRLARSGEITPMRMAGARFRRIVFPVLLAGLAGAVFSYAMAEKAKPWANRRANRILARIWNQSVMMSAKSNIYVRAGDYAVYVGMLSRTGEGNFSLQNVLAYSLSKRGPRSWLTAREAFINGKVWTFSQVVRRDVDAQGLTRRETRAPQWTLILPSEVDFLANARRPDEMTRPELRTRVEMMRRTGAGDLARIEEMEYHNRLALPFACVALALLAAPLSFLFARGGTFVGVLVSIICGFLYWNVMLFDGILGATGVLPTPVAAWMQNMAFGALAAYLVHRVG